MPYTPKTWENKPSTASPINATNLNHMEGGIKTNDDNILGAQNAILTLQGEMLQAQGDISALETLVDSIFPVDTESGNPAVITDAFGGACKSLKLTLEPIQSGSGTPSPANPRPITGRTQSTVKRTGKNELPLVDEIKVQNGVTFTPIKENGHVVGYDIDGTATGNFDWWFALSVGLKAGVNRYITTGLATAKTGFQIVIAPGFVGVETNKTLNIAISSLYFNVTSGTSFSHLIVKPMICLNSFTDKSFAPYDGESITRTYGTTIYGGTDDVTGEGATSELGYIEFDGSNDESMSVIFGDRISIVCPNDSITNNDQSAVTGKLFSNRFVEKSNYATLLPEEGILFRATGVHEIVISLGSNNPTTVEGWRTWLSQNPVQVAYGLATPTSIPLTAQNVTLLHGDNVLTTDADSIEASYSADIALYIEKKIAEGSNNNRSVDNSSLSKGGPSESTEEVKEENEEEEIEEPKKEETR